MIIIWCHCGWKVYTDSEVHCLHLVSLQAGYRFKGICEITGQSERFLHRIFLRDTGLPPKTWLTLERMVVARRMLRADVHPHLVAEKLGFANPGNFRREFRRMHGVLPSQFQLDCRTPLETDPTHLHRIIPDVG